MISLLEVRTAYINWHIANSNDNIAKIAGKSLRGYIDARDSIPLPDSKWSKQKAYDCRELGVIDGELISCLYYRTVIKRADTVKGEKDAVFTYIVYNRAIFSDDDEDEIVGFEPVGYDYETDDELFIPDF